MDNPLLREPLTADAHQAAAARPLGDQPGPVVRLRPRLPADPAHRPAAALPGRPRARRPGPGGRGLSRRHLLRDLSGRLARRGRDAQLFRQFSAPGGIPSHVSVTTPGSIHEGGELGYVLVHAFGAVLDNPDLIALAVVGDGEAETGPLEGSWKGISFLNPERDGAVLPVLHLNGAKIAGPTVLGRKDPAEVRSLLEGHGYEVLEVDRRRPARHAPPVRRRRWAGPGPRSGRSRPRPATAAGTAPGHAGR